MKLFRKCVCFLLIVIFCTSSLHVVLAASPHVQAYWAIQKEYVKALESGNETSILNACVKIVELYKAPANYDQYNAAAWPCEKAAKIYEKRGEFDNARKYYQKFLEYVTYLHNNGKDYSDSIKIAKAVLTHLNTQPQLYTDATYPADEKFFGAKWEPHNKTYFGTSAGFHEGAESAALIYVSFLNEKVGAYDWKVPKDTSIPVDYAWNIPNDSFEILEQIANGAHDAYIIENMQYFATVKNPVLLRFAAEVNCWSTLPADKAKIAVCAETFKKAFIRVSNFAKQYAPNVAMIYSPNDVSSWYTDAKTFYPGDAYVDWIGVSMYCDLSQTTHYEPGNGNDVFFFSGLYDNPILRIKEAVEVSNNKPVVISECGCGYAPEEGQTKEHFIKMLNFFYSYVNMVYPQVKMVFYFDSNVNHKYKISDNEELYSVYKKAVANNIPMQASLNGTPAGYTRFSTLHETRDYINLYTYAAFPSEKVVSVGYTLDGKGLVSWQTAPYKARIDVSALAPGKHTLKVAVSCAATYKTYEHVFYVGENNFVSTKPIGKDIGVTVNGKYVHFDTQPQIKNGRTLVPLRAIFEALGATVTWDNATRTVKAQRGSTQISMTIGQSVFYVNGQAKTLEVPSEITNGRTLVPVRAIGESFGCKVDWINEKNLVKVVY